MVRLGSPLLEHGFAALLEPAGQPTQGITRAAAPFTIDRPAMVGFSCGVCAPTELMTVGFTVPRELASFEPPKLTGSLAPPWHSNESIQPFESGMHRSDK